VVDGASAPEAIRRLHRAYFEGVHEDETARRPVAAERGE